MKSVPTAVGRKMEGEGAGGRSGIFRDRNFGRNVWMKALKVGLNQICFWRGSFLCNRSAVSNEFALACA